MRIVGGVDIHRKQLTFDYVEPGTGRWERGRVAPADREHLAAWLTSTTTCAPSTACGRSASTRSVSTKAAPHRDRPGVIRGDRQHLASIVENQLSPVGRLQANAALAIMDVLAKPLDRLRQRLLATARHVHGVRVLMHEIYGVGGMTSLALCAWLGGTGRFSSSRKAVRFVGLDVTVHSSDNKRSPGRLSRQGPEVLRWLLFEAAKTSARASALGYSYYTTVRERIDANRACLSQARRIVRHAVHLLADLGDEAFTIVAQPAAPSTICR